MRTGIYPGTFDPITFGHMDIVRRALHVVDKLVIGVALDSAKEPLFDVKTRAAMVAQGTADAAVFGRLFISNPDLPVRLQAGAPLADWDMDTFYQGGEKGYLDYPRWEAA